MGESDSLFLVSNLVFLTENPCHYQQLEWLHLHDLDNAIWLLTAIETFHSMKPGGEHVFENIIKDITIQDGDIDIKYLVIF